MKVCDKCKLQVRGTATRCPLCQGRLTGEADEPVFPQVPTVYRQYRFYFKLLALISVAGAVLSVVLNLILPRERFWALFVVLGVACFWILLALAFRKRHNIPGSMTTLTVTLSLLSVGWDALTGWRGWSLDYVAPLLCMVAMVSLTALAKVRRLPVSDYIVWLMADILFGIVPLAFYLTGRVQVVTPTLLCIALSLISLTSLLLFEGRAMRLEIVKRFHL